MEQKVRLLRGQGNWIKMTMVIATRNQDKKKELKALLLQWGIDGKGLDEIDPEEEIPETEETGETLLSNALAKARAVFDVTGLPTIADDTGLEVDALDGAPGTHAARYAGEKCSYRDNVNKLLSEMKDVPPEQRTARFRTVTCYVDDRKELWSEGVVEGMIGLVPHGVHGFGYDPVFYLPKMGKTYAELSDDEKNAISHRGKAMRKLLDLLSTQFVSSDHRPLSNSDLHRNETSQGVRYARLPPDNSRNR